MIRTEKRKAIDTKGLPLFQPRETKLIPIEWEERHVKQKILYERVTDYVRRGYNQALKDKKGYIGFLMILMQRLVSSSTRAIRTTLERRLEVLKTSSDQIPLFQTDLIEDLEDLDAQEQLETLLKTRIRALKNEKAEVKTLLEEAKATEAGGTDAKAEALLKHLYELMQKDGDPHLKILIFTEFIPTQEMLTEFLVERGFPSTKLNGFMSLEERQQAQTAFLNDKQILISTDAGGEGLNLQFCHVVINYDLPWNPMRIEQRIGRVDRIGQIHPVKALNFIFEDTVEFRVRDVLEEKLETILLEFGVDKAGDVLDSVQAGQLFDELYMDTLINPDDWEEKIESVVDRVHRSASDSRENTALFSPDDQLDPSAAEKLLSHPLPFWVEKMTLSYLNAYGGGYEKNRDGATQTWNLTWPDGDSMEDVFFALRENILQAKGRYLSLENNKIRGLSLHLPRFVRGQPIPYVNLPGLSPDIKGFWSLWNITLQRSDWDQRKSLALFVHDDGRNLIPTANHLWDLMISEKPSIYTFLDGYESESVFDRLRKFAEESGKPIFEGLVRKHQDRITEEREKTQYSVKSRRKAINRLGLPEVRAYRLAKLELEAKQFHLEMQKKERLQPELKPLIIVHVQG